ncbi:MFS general substrate transporter [Schizopora paradoxa]|uniref:MFS general substrate transporter n=1 Tax=Schizopora paradoxa TaxID=27342 RepID=A0A0H2SCT9_9AGAM|nr:MFS general substrate transporter [Schizopora paradoxa]
MTVDSTMDNERTPLLESSGHDGSVASNSPETCSPVRKQPLSKPFPWRAVISICLLAAVQPIGFELIFPFVNQMIVENGIVQDPERVGFYSGVIESLFSLMSFVAIMPCSIASDHLGRKPIVLIGTAGLAISMIFFGMSKTYGAMIATRCIGGMLGGTYSALKVMLAEVTDKSQAAVAFGGFTIAYRMGQIVGQPIGGVTSHPERQLSLFDTPFWNKYPFALPCFISAAFAIVAVFLGYFFTEETLASKTSKRASSTSRSLAVRSSSTDNQDARNDKQGWRRYFDRSMYTPHLLSVLICTIMMCFTSEILFAVYPLFAFTPISSGGLGLSEAQIGVHMATRSLNNVLVMMLYTPIHNRLGAVSTMKLAMVFWPISAAFFPVLNVLARQGAVGTLGFNILVGLFFTAWSFAGICWKISSYSERKAKLELLQSISQMMSSLCLGIAPAFITSLFAFSVKSQIANGNLVWIVTFGFASLGTLQVLTLKEPTHDWREDSKNVADD